MRGKRPPSGSAPARQSVCTGAISGWPSLHDTLCAACMSITELLEPIDMAGGKIYLPTASNWMQGRTLYGGASALLAYTAAIRAYPDQPPLRAGQIGFVAPVGEDMELTAEIIRQGRNVTQIRSEILSRGRIALTAFWVFGTPRESNGVYRSQGPEPSPGGADGMEIAPSDRGPNFLRNNFEVRYPRERRAKGDPVLRHWIRLKEPSGLDALSELILLGDTLPSSTARIMERPGPISSINWSFNILDPEPKTDNRWWLAETASDHADHGYSSERLRLWNASGKQVMGGMQAVAIFG